ncbi:LLM class F420-dependent oxidoreductase [Amycolatopsis viridis]|uniref:F420-dependent oxidoreductase n=1 Tax=Amycolatopsis viridis TaxID=185678 RepID=A0ABX0SVI7_9PSEU|nr:LLM class F420-dependent oxidoreductase [Amycolatopsis viridis]NIH79525.1 putative F420-dependent oxidoreductase [Amycolatopsis viridis]
MKLGISTFVTDESARPDVLAKAVEERGFDALFIAEHSHIPVSRESPYPPGGEMARHYYRALDPFVVLTAAAAATTALTLGTGIALLIQRDVLHTAKSVASLDLLSGGRFLFGVGAGWNREEMRNHGTDPRTRGALLDEQIQALRTLWTNDEAEFHGVHVDFDPVFQWPKPAREVPVYIGGTSAAALDRAKRLGAGWLPSAVRDPEAATAQLAHAGSVPVTATSAPPDPGLLDAYAEAGAERVTLALPASSAGSTMRRLDALAALVPRFS